MPDTLSDAVFRFIAGRVAPFLTPAPPAFDFAGAFSELRSFMSDKIDALDASIAKLNEDVAAATAAEATFADTMKALASTADTLRAANTTIQSALDAKTSELEIDETELTKANDAVAASAAKIEELTAALKAPSGGVTTNPPDGTAPAPVPQPPA